MKIIYVSKSRNLSLSKILKEFIETLKILVITNFQKISGLKLF